MLFLVTNVVGDEDELEAFAYCFFFLLYVLDVPLFVSTLSDM